MRVRTGLLAAAMAGLLSIGAASGAQAKSFNANAGTLGAIPDGTATPPPAFGSPRSVTFTVSGVSGSLTNVGLNVNISHTYVGDLDMALQAPDGTEKHIVNRVGAVSVDDFGDSSDLSGSYTFSDSAPTSPTLWQAAQAPGCANACVIPTGAYRATTGSGANTLITPAFTGVPNLNGEWKLLVYDATQGDTGNVAGATLTVTGDETPPAKPVVTTNPTSPANNNIPVVRGTAEAGSTVSIYINGACSGAAADTMSAADFAFQGYALLTPDDSTAYVTARAEDAANNVSACSDPVQYVEDSTAPSAPQIHWEPASPSPSATATLIGSAEAGSTVTIYDGGTCEDPQVVFTAAELAAGITLPIEDGTTQTTSATALDAAGNLSPCSNAASHTRDATAPAAPTLTSTDPAAPADNNDPKVKGTAEAGSTVRLYADSICAGTPIATGSAADLGGAGISITVLDNSINGIRATATDAAGNSSACSESISYEEATPTPPGVPPADNQACAAAEAKLAEAKAKLKKAKESGKKSRIKKAKKKVKKAKKKVAEACG